MFVLPCRVAIDRGCRRALKLVVSINGWVRLLLRLSVWTAP